MDGKAFNHKKKSNKYNKDTKEVFSIGEGLFFFWNMRHMNGFLCKMCSVLFV